MNPCRAISFAVSLFAGLASIQSAIGGRPTSAFLCALGAGLSLFSALTARNEQEDA